MTASTHHERPRRRWYQFRIRSLLVVVTLICVGLGLWPSWCDYRLLHEYLAVSRANPYGMSKAEPPPSLLDFRGTYVGHWTLLRALRNEEEASIGIVYSAFRDLKVGAKPAVPGLVEMLSHPNAKFRERAAMALSEIGADAKAAVERLGELRNDQSEDMRVRASAHWALNFIDRDAEAKFWKGWHVTVTPETPISRGPMRISGEFLQREHPVLVPHPVLFEVRDNRSDGTSVTVQSGGGNLEARDSETVGFSIDSTAPYEPGRFELVVKVLFTPVLKVPIEIAPAANESTNK